MGGCCKVLWEAGSSAGGPAIIPREGVHLRRERGCAITVKVDALENAGELVAILETAHGQLSLQLLVHQGLGLVVVEVCKPVLEDLERLMEDGLQGGILGFRHIPLGGVRDTLLKELEHRSPAADPSLAPFSTPCGFLCGGQRVSESQRLMTKDGSDRQTDRKFVIQTPSPVVGSHILGLGKRKRTPWEAHLRRPLHRGHSNLGVRKVVRRHVHAILAQERENRI